ncbi:S-layer homology domain-containing protein [Tuberibacillus calidus]|uniref:S-layer homology domain-containing protein n=1 Tax=Tuberibacillus calidus TaxID=340097 RepID=UPI000428F473|nr:S-layer homology domain-containing protein [Tuberibacillus calidus]
MKKIALPIVAFVFMFAVTLLNHHDAYASAYPWADEAAKALSDRGILKGDSSGDFLLGKKVTRSEFAAFVGRALNLQTFDTTKSFSDVDPNHPLYNEIYEAASAGIINGYPDGTFKPDQYITRDEMSVMIYRMLKYKGIVTETKPLTFADKSKINKGYVEAIENCVAWSIIEGYGDNTFRPKNDAIRAEAVVVIYRALGAIENTGGWYHVGTVVKGEIQDGARYSHFTDARNHATASNQVVTLNNKVVWMHSGIVRTSAMVTFGDTYVSSNTELKYLGSDAYKVNIELNGNKGSVDQSKVTLIPNGMIDGRSYYKVSGNTLYHYVYQPLSGQYAAYQYGYAPGFMTEGVKYYSWDGHSFYTTWNATGKPVGTAYQYFDILPLKTKTSYTADQLNQFVKDNIPSTYAKKLGGPGPLAKLGNAFIKAQNDYGVNAMYLLAHAIHESAWGSSDIAQNKHNLFGLGAADSDPYNGAKQFATYEECIDYMGQFVKDNYLTPGTWRYFGAMLGDKNAGMNMKYASDPYWGQKIAGYMFQIDKYLGGRDFNKYVLAVATADSLNVRANPTTSSKILYQYPETHSGAGMIVTKEVSNGEGTWYEILSDQSDFRSPVKAYVYHNGTYGLLANKVTIAK